MKSFLTILTLVLLLVAFIFAASAYLGQDLLLTIKNEVDKNLLGSDEKNKEVILKFAVVSDTHSDSENTAKAMEQAKNLGVEYIVHTGDWTNVGTIAEFTTQKDLFEQVKIPYYGIMGDHDRWQSGTKNFEIVLGKTYESFEKKGVHHILLDSSDIINGLYPEELDWLEADLKEANNKPIIIFMHLPIYHPTSDRTISNKAGSDSTRNIGSDRFLNLIKGKKVIALFSGDHHLSSSYTEPTTSFRIFITGAVTRERNLQKPRFSLVEVYKNYSISVKDQVIN